MALQLGLDDIQILRNRINEKAYDLFKAKPGVAELQVNRFDKIEDGHGARELRFHSSEEVVDLSQIQNLRRSEDSISQIFCIRQQRTWSTLDISRELFEGLLAEYGVFSPFWKCVFTFGRKCDENEFEFPSFRARRTPRSEGDANEIHESAYMLRRVELNGRELTDGQSPWSIRQTGVYHQLAVPSTEDADQRSTFILIAPSKNSERQMGENLDAGLQNQSIRAWNNHRLLVADSMTNWMEYMSYLEEQLREQSDRIVLANVGTEKENLSPLTDFNVNFVDRQTLKILEDSVIDLQVILSTMSKTVTRLRDHCKKTCERTTMKEEEREIVELILDELDEFVREADLFVERGKVLKEKAHSTTQLLSDLLDYEEAVALKELAKETQLESKSMYQLTERSTKDAAAMKILTVITLIYLPTTIVANFFSTQFVNTNDEGQMRLSDNAWLLAAIAVPLTVVTIALWGGWVYFTKVLPPPENEQPSTLPSILRRRQSSFKSMLSSRRKMLPSPKILHSASFKSVFSAKKRPTADVEKGEIPTPEKPIQPANPPQKPLPHVGFNNETWSSIATTVKFG